MTPRTPGSDLTSEEAGLLREAAWEVYGAEPSEFVAVRTGWVKRLRAEKRRELAGEVQALRKPSVAAHAMTVAVRAGGPALESLLRVGERLRHAQATMDVGAMTALRPERDEALAGWVAAVREAAGGTLTAAVEDEVRSTGVAVLADAGAAAALTGGMLTRALSYSGFGEVDIADAVATTSTGVVLRRIEGGGGGDAVAEVDAEDTANDVAEVEQAQPAEGEATEDEPEPEEPDQGSAGPDLGPLRTELEEAEGAVEAARVARKEASGDVASAEKELAVAAKGLEQARNLLARAEEHARRAQQEHQQARERLEEADADLASARERRATARTALEEAEDA